MMRQSILAASIAASVVLGGCATNPGNGGGGGPSRDAIVQQVIQITSAVCDFVPTVSTVLEILSVNVPGLNTATAIAGAICNAVVPPRAVSPGVTTKARLGKVGGVQVRGRFT